MDVDAYATLCAMLEAIYRDGPDADLSDPPPLTSPQARAHALVIYELIEAAVSPHGERDEVYAAV